MTVKFLAILSFITIIHVGALAQKTAQEPVGAQEPKKVYRPDIPGNFLVDFGFSGTVNAPVGFDIKWFTSSTFNFYYYYPLRLGKSNFMITPGIGIGLDRFRFKYQTYLADTAVQEGRYELVSNAMNNEIAYPAMRKSIIAMDYLDVPLEFRFNANPEDLGRTFWVAVGGRIGVLYNSRSKIKYKLQTGEVAVAKDRYRHGLNPFRYGLSLRIGAGNFNLFSFYNLSPLFEKGKGPSRTDMNSFTIGVSLIGF